MQNNIKTISIIVIILFVIFLVFPSVIEARSGCCSHHGGVCTYQCPGGSGVGYMCCDRTSLSATCDPYYPDCPSNPICGDGRCNGSETCSTCSRDCGACSPVCGDQNCDSIETCSSCPRDCGVCPIPQPSQTDTDNTKPVNQASGAVAGTSTEKESSDWIWWTLGILAIGIVAYKIGKRKSKK